MINENFKRTSKFVVILLLACIIFSSLSFSTLAYFKFQKTFLGDGVLPILNINYKLSNNDPLSLVNLVYNGQESEEIGVFINTNGNNISGRVRLRAAISWSNSLSNKTYNNNNELISACFITYNNSLWEERNNAIYLKQPMEKDTEIEAVISIGFGENLPETYRGKSVLIKIFVDIYQDYNLPENW